MPSRRRFLRSGAAVAVGAGLAGCIFTSETISELPRPFLGASREDVPVIQTFEDLQCPACRLFTENEFPEVQQEVLETNDARFEWYDFPLPVDQQLSRPSHGAARSVQNNDSMESFWDVVDEILRQQSNIGSLEDIARICAENSDVEANTVLQEAREGIYEPVIESDVDEGEDMQVDGTPTIFVDGVQVRPTAQDILDAVENG